MITIEKMQPAQKETAKAMLRRVWHEFFGADGDEFVRNYFDNPAALADLDDVQTNYFDRSGTFLVVLDDGELVGTGAVMQLGNGICELRRLFLLKPYRGRGIGKKVALQLLDFARAAGYQRIRLATNKRLRASHRLYFNLGFYLISPYEENATDQAYYMEKVL
jgi:GNAT superfamily N-acetyltransferase